MWLLGWLLGWLALDACEPQQIDGVDFIICESVPAGPVYHPRGR